MAVVKRMVEEEVTLCDFCGEAEIEGNSCYFPPYNTCPLCGRMGCHECLKKFVKTPFMGTGKCCRKCKCNASSKKWATEIRSRQKRIVALMEDVKVERHEIKLARAAAKKAIRDAMQESE